MNIKGTQLTTFSGQETEELGESFAQKVAPGDVVCLYGELGAGKTTFVKGFAKGLGVTSRVISPTFVVVKTHSVDRKGIGQLYHIDLYRLEDTASIKGIGLEELLDDNDAIVLIEWADKLGKHVPTKRWDIKFEHVDDTLRKIRIDKYE